MKKESKPNELKGILEFLDNLNLDEKDFNKIYEKISQNIKMDHQNDKILTQIKEKAKIDHIDDKIILTTLINEIDVEELLGLFQSKDLNEFIQDFLLKKVL